MQTKAIFLLFMLLGGVGCATAVATPPSPAAVVPTPTHHAAVVVTVRITPTPSATPLTVAAAATAVTAAAPPPTATPHPMAPYTIEGLRQRAYPGGVIEIASWMADAEFFDKYAINYPSDCLTISGIMQMPKSEGPFPGISLTHCDYARVP